MKYSFLMLTWNRYKFLENSLEALLNSIEDFSGVEVVVMDNGSTDRTPEILNKFRAHPSVRVVTLKKNYGVGGYKKLFDEAKGEYMIVVDDDVLSFPARPQAIFTEYMEAFPDYGFLALNVIQDEFTNGAKPGPESYTEDTRNGRTVERGPAGGWCACLRRSDFRKLWLRFKLARLSMKYSEDSFLTHNLETRLKLKHGLIRDAVCFHACGPHYAKQYGHLAREMEKYKMSGLPNFVETYRSYEDKGSTDASQSN